MKNDPVRQEAVNDMGKWGTLLTVAGMLMLGGALPAQTGYKVIVNPSNPVASASKAQVAKFFLEKGTWDDGQPASAVDLPSASPTRELFSREVLGMPIPAVLSRWREASGSGRGDAPPSMATDREVLAFVRLKPGGIGYVSAATETPGVKVISLDKADTTARSREPLEVGGAIPMPERIEGVRPAYPTVARAARLEGQVDIEVVIGISGNVEKARVVMRSAPSLDDAAITAVRQWKYRPTVINGVPVPIKARVRVSFVL